MKFELEPYNRGLIDETLLDDLRAIAQKMRKNFVTKEEYDKVGRLCSATFQNRFGSWSRAHELAGLRKIRNFDATADDCVADLKCVSEKIGRTTVSTSDYKLHGRFSVALIARRCGSYKAALERAGLTVSPLYHEKVPEDDLFENLEHLWESLGRQPKTDDFVKPHSRFSREVYRHRFGSIRKALEAFVASIETDQSHREERPEPQAHAPDGFQSTIRHRTSRTISWRIRFLVMRRDNFKCRITGRSPATDPTVILEVDHIVPWEKGGETVMENLQTLVKQINIGKSNLDMHADGQPSPPPYGSPAAGSPSGEA